jgi:hypothetical protein
MTVAAAHAVADDPTGGRDRERPTTMEFRIADRFTDMSWSTPSQSLSVWCPGMMDASVRPNRFT